MRKGERIYFDTYECSDCGEEFESDDWGNNTECPECGGTAVNQN